MVAITANTLVLKLARPMGIQAESGGLLKLVVHHLGPILEQLGISRWWVTRQLPGPASLAFWLAFHYLTGLAMVGLYSRWLEPRLPGQGLTKGSLFSLLPWLLNGLGVLPLLGQGIFGWQTLSLPGMAYFLFANWVFGAMLGTLFERFRTKNSPSRRQKNEGIT